MAYDRNDRPHDERFGNDERNRGARDDDRFRGQRDDPRAGGDRSGGRGFFERAGDEISSWFGDEEAERRRVQDDRSGGYGRPHEQHRAERGGFFGELDRGRGEHERGGFFGGHNDREQPRDEQRGGWFGRDERDEDRAGSRPEFNRAEQERGRRDYGAPQQREDYRPFAGDYGRGSSNRFERSEPRGVGAGSALAGAAMGAASSKQHDPHYAEWRQRQIDQLDHDYDEYRREHQSKFDNDFSGWRSQRQTKRQTLGQVRDHMEVVGSDEQVVGRVDKVQGDRIILTKDSQGGVHKSFSCNAIDRVDGDRLILTQPADEARRSLVEERGFQERNAGDDRSGSMAQDRQRQQQQSQQQGDGPHILERSFSGTYPDDASR
jgi:hypothetical protein